MDKPLPDILDIKIRSRDKTVFEGQALHLTSNNSLGSFTVLPRHANFISIIRDFIIIKATDRTEQRIEIDETAILKVFQNHIDIFLGLTSDKKPTPTPSKKLNPTSLTTSK